MQRLRIDPDVTAWCCTIPERLLDFAAAGKMQAVGVAKEGQVELLSGSSPGRGPGGRPPAAAGCRLQRISTTSLIRRAVTRQGGRMTWRSPRAWLPLRLVFPGTAAE